MRIGIITKDIPPFHCGIGDHSINLANAIRLAGEEAVIIASRGNSSEHIHVVECDWGDQGLEKLYRKLESLDLDHLILQFTLLMYINDKDNKEDIKEFWKRCSQRWKASIIIHETYFLKWWYPPSWLTGLPQKHLLKQLVRASHFVFSASQPLIDEIDGWNKSSKTTLLPIGSNFPIALVNREKIRDDNLIGADDVVLMLFGGGNSLKWLRGHVNVVDTLLKRKGVKVQWLLLGGVPKEWFKLNARVISPSGRLSPEEISGWFLASDIFLMPHYAGLCAKRGTLMAAMQHSLPVVGTEGQMTDQFWSEVPGVVLVTLKSPEKFSEKVYDLCRGPNLRRKKGHDNQLYFQKYFTWEKIASKFLAAID